MDHPKRSLIKALSWRTFGFITTTVIVYIYSGNVAESFAVGIGVESVKLLLYYMHERIWNKVEYGRVKEPEYQI